MKVTIETEDLTEARVLLRAAYEFRASHLVPVTEQGKQLGIPTDADNKPVDAIAGHDALMRPEKKPCTPCEEKAKRVELKQAEVKAMAEAIQPPAAEAPSPFKAAVDAWVEKNGSVMFIKKLKEFGVRRATDIPEDQQGAFLDILAGHRSA